MIMGYHVIFGAYGFWLPNDPRGSWSDFVGSWEVFRYGHATKTEERISLAKVPHDPALRLVSKNSLKRQSVEFTGLQARAVGIGLANYFGRAQLQVWACAILPDHVHLVIAPPKIKVEKLVVQLKGDATRSLKAEGLHPFGGLMNKKGRTPTCFARGEWKVYLQIEDIARSIEYVEHNPVKEGKKRQRWSFVTAFC